MIQKLQRVITGVLLTVFLAIGFCAPVYASSIQPESYLYRVNVSSMDKSIDFYTNVLGMERDKEMDTLCQGSAEKLCWTEFKYPGLDGKIGLWQGNIQGTASAVLTIVVKDIDDAVKALKASRVEVSGPTCAGKGVSLAFFKDPDCNRLAFRQERKPECQ